jgi:HlyD family secretion protein
MHRLPPHRRGRAAHVMTGLVLLLVAVAGCASKPAAAPPPPPKVVTTVASFGTIHPGENLAGIIAPFQNVAIQSSLTEPADQVNVQEGDRVYKGEVLAQLDTADLEANLQADIATAQSDAASTTHNVYQGSLTIDQGVDSLRSAEAAVRQARQNYLRDNLDLGRYRSLVAHGYISQQQVDQQLTTVRNDEDSLRSAQASLAAARSNVTANGTLGSGGLQSSAINQARATEQVALAQAQQQRVQIQKATIVSPIDGVVVNRNLNPGEYPGSRQIFTLQQVDPVYAVLQGSGAQVAQIRSGAKATIIASDLHRSRFTGTVVGVLNQINPGSTDFEVKIVLPNHSGVLRPGMAIGGSVALPGARGVLVPETAFIDDNHDSLMIVQPDRTVKTVQVAEVASDGKTAVVSGLAPDSRVISDGQTSVGNGQKVAIR